MAYKQPRPTAEKPMILPINVMFRFLQSRARVVVWIRDNVNKRFEGNLIGFDEWLNLVLDDTVEMNIRSNVRRNIGRILLRGETVTLVSLHDQSGNADRGPMTNLAEKTIKNVA